MVTCRDASARASRTSAARGLITAAFSYRSIACGQSRSESPGVDPDQLRIEGQSSFLPRHSVAPSKQGPEPMESGREGALRSIGLRIMSERVDKPFLPHLAATKRDERFEKPQWASLHLSRKRQRFIVSNDREAAECVHAYRPRPDLDIGRH